MSTVKRKATPAANAPAQLRRVRKGRPFVQSGLDESIGFALRKAYQFGVQEVAAILKRFNMRPKDYAVMVLIGAAPGQTQSAISVAYGIQKTNFVTLITSLEERKLVERRKVDGDRRAFALHLTKAGEKLLHEMEIVHSLHEEILRARLGERKSRQLLKLLFEFNSASQLSK